MDAMGRVDLRGSLLHPHTFHERDVQENDSAAESQKGRLVSTSHRSQDLATANQLLRNYTTHPTSTHVVHRTDRWLRLPIQRLHLRANVHLHHRLTLGLRALLRFQRHGDKSILPGSHTRNSHSTMPTDPDRPLLLPTATPRIRKALSTRNTIPTRAPTVPSDARMLRPTSVIIYLRLDDPPINPLDLPDDIPRHDDALQPHDLRACKFVHDRFVRPAIWSLGGWSSYDFAIHFLSGISVVCAAALRRAGSRMGDVDSRLRWFVDGACAFLVLPLRRMDTEPVEIREVSLKIDVPSST